MKKDLFSFQGNQVYKYSTDRNAYVFYTRLNHLTDQEVEMMENGIDPREEQ